MKSRKGKGRSHGHKPMVAVVGRKMVPFSVVGGFVVLPRDIFMFLDGGVTFGDLADAVADKLDFTAAPAPA